MPHPLRNAGDDECVLRLQLLSYRAERRCPNCGMHYRSAGGYGSGRVDDGVFCSLDCFAKFWYEGRLR